MTLVDVLNSFKLGEENPPAPPFLQVDDSRCFDFNIKCNTITRYAHCPYIRDLPAVPPPSLRCARKPGCPASPKTRIARPLVDRAVDNEHGAIAKRRSGRTTSTSPNARIPCQGPTRSNPAFDTTSAPRRGPHAGRHGTLSRRRETRNGAVPGWDVRHLPRARRSVFGAWPSILILRLTMY